MGHPFVNAVVTPAGRARYLDMRELTEREQQEIGLLVRGAFVITLYMLAGVVSMIGLTSAGLIIVATGTTMSAITLLRLLAFD